MRNSKISTKTWHIVQYSFVALLATSSMLAAPVASADKKIFPATICQIWDGDRDKAEFLSYSQFGRVSNTHSTQRIGIVCPIMRDRPDRPMDLRVYWADAFLGSGANNSGVLGCRLRSNTVWGNASLASQAHSSENWSGTVSGGVKSGSFTWQNLFAQTSGNVGSTSTYTLFCLLPPVSSDGQSFIGSIVTLED